MSVAEEVVNYFGEGDEGRFALRLSKAHVEELRAVSRVEAIRRREDVSWGDLVREAIAHIVKTRKPIG